MVASPANLTQVLTAITRILLGILHEIGASYVFAGWMKKCDCGKQLDPDGYHLITCKSGGGSVWTHNSIVGLWSECLSHLHIVHKKEPKHHHSDSDDRSDIFAVDLETSNDIELDVSMAHPWALDVVNKAAVEDGAAALCRKELKKSIYRAKSLPGGATLNFVPLVLWPFRFRGKQLLSQLSLIDKLTNLSDNSPDNFKSYWGTRFSAALQQCNAKALIQKISRV